MKTRTSFVSNSSTCSFILLGFEIPYNREIAEQIVAALGLGIKYEEFIDELDHDEEYELGEFLYAVGDAIKNRANVDGIGKIGLQNEVPGVKGTVIGIEPFFIDGYEGIYGSEGGVPIDGIAEKLDMLCELIGLKAEYRLYGGTYQC